MKYLAIIVSGVVLAAIVAGFYVAGSPSSVRAKQFDSIRTGHLQMLQSEILSYWQRKGTVPSDLAELRDDISGFQAPVDPATNAQYEYTKITTEKFSLCAVFETDDKALRPKSPESVPYPGGPFIGEENWQHNIGRSCFERTIDKEKYKLNNTPIVK